MQVFLQTLLIICCLLPPIGKAAIFTVQSLADDTGAVDLNPGDGICSDNFGACTLRAAIMEANALDGDDAIEFGVNGTIHVDPSAGALPVITEFLIIDGSSAPGFNSAGTTLLTAPPVIVVNGAQLSGIITDGLRINGAAAADSQILSIAVVNFPDNGVEIGNGADGLIIQGSNISGNEGIGISAIGVDFMTIGQTYGFFTSEFLGLGNLVALNGEDGIQLFNCDDNQLFGNFIGTFADGNSNGGNDGNGLTMIGNDNLIGFFDADERAGNIVANNGGLGLRLAGNNNTVYANRIGLGANDGFYGNGGDGIVITGSGNRIGDAQANSHNDIANNRNGIRVGTSAIAAAQTIIQNNRIGVTFGALGNVDDGILVERGDAVQILDNQIINNGRHGIFSSTNDNIIQGNMIGAVGSADFGNTDNGIQLSSAAERAVIGGPNASDANIIGGNNGLGMELSGPDHQVVGNYIGVTPGSDDIGNDGHGILIRSDGTGFLLENNVVGFNSVGIWLGGHSHAVEFNDIGTDRNGGNAANQFDGIALPGNASGFNNSIGPANRIAYNGRYGILGSALADQAANYLIFGNRIIQNGESGMVIPFFGDNGIYSVRFNELAYNGDRGILTFGADTRVSLLANTMYGNVGIAVDIDGSGQDANDPDDDDTGPNRRMNYPDILSAAFIPGSPAGVSVDFSVDATAANASYPLKIDAFWTDREEVMQGRLYLTRVTYPTPQAMQNAIFDLNAFATTGGQIALMATDALGNSSELSPSVTFGTIDLIMRDGFETFNAGF